MLGPQQPLGEAEPVARQIVRERRQHRRRRRRHLVAALVVLAAVQDERHRRLGFLLHHVGDRAAGLDVGLLAHQRVVRLPTASCTSSSRLVSHQSYSASSSASVRLSGGAATTADSADFASDAISPSAKLPGVDAHVLDRRARQRRRLVPLADLERHRRLRSCR